MVLGDPNLPATSGRIGLAPTDPNAGRGPGIGAGAPLAPGAGPSFPAASGLSVMAADGSACLTQGATEARMCPCDGSQAQRWASLGGGLHAIAGTACLTSPDTGSGAPLMATCKNLAAQRFTLASGLLYAGSSTGPDVPCLSDPTADANVVLAPCAAGLALVLGWDGVQVQVAGSGSDTRCLAGSASAVQLAACVPGDISQLWQLAGGAVVLPSLRMCLDLAGGSVALGTRAVLAPCGAAPSQQWRWQTSDGSLRPQSSPDLYLHPSGNAVVLLGRQYGADNSPPWTLTR